MSSLLEVSLEVTDTHGFGFFRAGKHLGVGIGYVLELARHERVRPLPRSDGAFMGYVIFRGRPLPVLDPLCFLEEPGLVSEGVSSGVGAIQLAVLGVDKKPVVGIRVDQVGQVVELGELRVTHRSPGDLVMSLVSSDEQNSVHFIRVDRLFDLYQLVTPGK